MTVEETSEAAAATAATTAASAVVLASPPSATATTGRPGSPTTVVTNGESGEVAPTAAAFWSPLPVPDLSGGSPLRCDVCGASGFLSASSLHQHQTQLHVNPVFLSEDDAALRLASDSSDLYRCHICLRKWAEKADLKEHLDAHAKERPEDFEEVEQRPSVQQIKDKEMKLAKHFKQRKKRQSGVEAKKPLISTAPAKTASTPSPAIETLEIETEATQPVTPPPSSCRPGRQCKTNASALVAISIADERLNIDFEKAFRTTERKQKKSSPSPASTDKKPEAGGVKSPGGSGESRLAPEASTDVSENQSTKEEATASENGGEAATSLATASLPEKSSASNVVRRRTIPQKKGRLKAGGKGKKKKKRRLKLSNKKIRRAPGLTTASGSSENRQMGRRKGTAAAVAGASSQASSGESPTAASPSSKSKKVVASIEEILPDLKPTKPVQSPRIMTKRLTSEVTKAALVVRQVTEEEECFVCLVCGAKFETYVNLRTHKEQHHVGEVGKKATKKIEISTGLKYKTDLRRTAKSATSGDKEYSAFISKSVREVPQTTFNNLHGNLSHIGTVDGLYYRSRGGSSAMGALEKVRLNVSDPWTTKDVWEYGAWEVSKKPLSWHRYEDVWTEVRRFHERMSFLPWPVQQRFKDVYDNCVDSKGSATQSTSHEDIAGRGYKKLMNGLELKQTHRSVKYMTAAEREDRAAELAEAREVRIVGEIRGEWELEHVFMCTTCAEPYDELREVLHHKWDAHPYCLVAHVTILEKVNLPPLKMIHPQLGRSLKPPSVRRQRRARLANGYLEKAKAKQQQQQPKKLVCTKCQKADFEGSYEIFAGHVLVCGGDSSLEEQKKSGKKAGKKGGKPRQIRTLTAEEREKELERRKARFARFAQPPPLRLKEGSGRLTRFQITMIQKEEEEELKKKKAPQKKRGRKPKKNSSAEVLYAPNADATPPTDIPIQPSRRKRESESGGSGTSSPLPARPRRSMVNYARDRSLREGSWQLRPQQQEQEIQSILKQESETEFELEKKTEEVTDAVKVKQEADGHVEEAKLTRKRRRASCTNTMVETANMTPRKKASRLSLDSKIALKEEVHPSPASPRRRSTTTRRSPPVNGTIREEEGGQPVGIDRENDEETKKDCLGDNTKYSSEEISTSPNKVDSAEAVDDNVPLIRLKSPRKKKSPARPLSSLILNSPAKAIKRRRSMHDDAVTGTTTPSNPPDSNALVPSPRKRRVSSATSAVATLLSVGADRSIFPREVKIAAVERISKGESHSAVARDLQCPTSTVASWWYRRTSLLGKGRAAAAAANALPDVLNSSGEDSPDSRVNGFSSSSSSSSSPAPEASTPTDSKDSDDNDKNFALVPYERNVILEKMRQRVADAFQVKEDDGEAAVKNESEAVVAGDVVDAVDTPEQSSVDAAAEKRCESRTSTASAGLSMILDNYGGDDDIDGDDDEEESADAKAGGGVVVVTAS